MTFLVRIKDPAAPRRPGAAMESARAFASAEGNPLPALLALHEETTAEYDLDDPEDARAFVEAYGERMIEHVLRMQEGEDIAISCTQVEAEEPGPVLAREPRTCPFCKSMPDIQHEWGRGYRVRCPGCGITAGTGEWHLQLSKAVEHWNDPGAKYRFNDARREAVE